MECRRSSCARPLRAVTASSGSGRGCRRTISACHSSCRCWRGLPGYLQDDGDRHRAHCSGRAIQPLRTAGVVTGFTTTTRAVSSCVNPRGGILSQPVPAAQVMHTYCILRPGQVRGVPWLAPVMLAMRDLDDYRDAEPCGRRRRRASRGSSHAPRVRRPAHRREVHRSENREHAGADVSGMIEVFEAGGGHQVQRALASRRVPRLPHDRAPGDRRRHRRSL